MYSLNNEKYEQLLHFFCIPSKIESHTGLKLHDSEEIMTDLSPHCELSLLFMYCMYVRTDLLHFNFTRH